jgi:hypothetical protein
VNKQKTLWNTNGLFYQYHEAAGCGAGATTCAEMSMDGLNATSHTSKLYLFKDTPNEKLQVGQNY